MTFCICCLIVQSWGQQFALYPPLLFGSRKSYLSFILFSCLLVRMKWWLQASSMWNPILYFLMKKYSFSSISPEILCSLHLFYLIRHTCTLTLHLCLLIQISVSSWDWLWIIPLEWVSFPLFFICWAICTVSWILWMLYNWISGLWYTPWKIFFKLFTKQLTLWT